MKIVIVIPARGGSKGLKNKNIMPLLGKPLIGYTIEAAKESVLADKIVVSTEDANIAACATSYSIPVIKRPEEYATDEAPIEWALRHTVTTLKETEGYSADIVVWLQANVPIRKPGQIDKVIQKLIDTGSDSVLTVTTVTQRPEFMKKMVEGDKIIHMAVPKETRRQEYKDDFYVADGAVIAIRTHALIQTEGMTGAHIYLGTDIRGVVEEPQYAIEIDDQFDYDIAEGYLLVEQKRKKQMNNP
jgi:CMP-N,N'-diacetyllegionaminic acid synthase